MGRKIKILEHGKKALKNTPRLYLYNQILMSGPKIFYIKQKDNFERQNKKIITKNTKDIILSREWIKFDCR